MAKKIQATRLAVGVDGCKAGWIAIYERGGSLKYSVVAELSKLIDELVHPARIFIDIPIGLPDGSNPIRPPETLARKILGKRHSSVFPVPCREALKASSIAEARQINLRVLNKSISNQTWGISEKIHEIDTLLQSGKYPNLEIREVHPEICFWSLAKKRPILYGKKTAEGRAERLQILAKLDKRVETVFEEVLRDRRRSDVGPDDIIDAAVAFVTAKSTDSELATLSGIPAADQFGIRMEMVFRA